MSRANSRVFERSEFPDLQRILNFYPLRNLASNELFFAYSFRKRINIKVGKLYEKYDRLFQVKL